MTGTVPTLPESLEKMAGKVSPEAMVYVHVELHAGTIPLLARIWLTTYLVDITSAHRSRLLHAENISFAPMWTLVYPRTWHRFLLIFSGLPAGCKMFDLVEEPDVGEAGAFVVRHIARNVTDVYRVRIAP